MSDREWVIYQAASRFLEEWAEAEEEATEYAKRLNPDPGAYGATYDEDRGRKREEFLTKFFTDLCEKYYSAQPDAGIVRRTSRGEQVSEKKKQPVTWSITVEPPPEPPEGWKFWHYSVTAPSEDGQRDMTSHFNLEDAVAHWVNRGIGAAGLQAYAYSAMSLDISIRITYTQPDDDTDGGWDDWPDVSVVKNSE